MMHSRRIAAGAFTLAAFMASSAWAAQPVARAAQRQKAEKQIAKTEQRLANIQPDAGADPLAAQINLDQAKRNLELAQKLMKYNNPEAATLFAAEADRFITLAEGKAVQQ
jgi:cytochrome c556